MEPSERINGGLVGIEATETYLFDPENNSDLLTPSLPRTGTGITEELPNLVLGETAPSQEETPLNTSDKPRDPITGELLRTNAEPSPETPFTTGVFATNSSGEITVNYLFDGGWWKSEVGIFSLAGMSAFTGNSNDYAKEAARRILSNTQGHLIISDSTEGAEFTANLPHEFSYNQGEYPGSKTFTLTPGETFGVARIISGTFEEVESNTDPYLPWNLVPIYSMATDDPGDFFDGSQIADIAGNGNAFGLEEFPPSHPDSDRDYNDIVFSIEGATTTITPLDDLIDPAVEWRNAPEASELMGRINGFPEAENLVIENLTADSPEPPTFTIDYISNSLETISLDNNDIRITNENNIDLLASFVEVTETSPGVYTATYELPAPTEGWDYTHNGTYTVKLEGSQVTDTNGNSVLAAPLGTFDVELTANYNTGVFTVGDTGEINIDFLFDGGFWSGELAIFSLEGMSAFEDDSLAFTKEAARRALTNSNLGHIVISDLNEGARFTADLPPREYSYNAGEYPGIKTISMTPGDEVGLMLIPNGTIAQVESNSDPYLPWELVPAFSIGTASPNDELDGWQIADITGSGTAFGWEEHNSSEGDRDYNDIIFSIEGATTTITPLDDLIDPAVEWRTAPEVSELMGRINGFPEAKNLVIENLTADSPEPPTFTIDYSSNNLDITSLDNNDIRITNENNIDLLASFIEVTDTSLGVYTATYELPAPTEGWDYTHNGTYTVKLEASQVTDTSGNSVLAAPLGTFDIELTANYNTGVFTVGDTGEINIDFLFDGGFWSGELAIFSLEGMSAFENDSLAFTKEAARRALSNSNLGHIVISDVNEGARFIADLVPREYSQNAGEYPGIKTISMTPGDDVGLMLIFNGTVAEVDSNSDPYLPWELIPAFSIGTASTNDELDGWQLVDITGNGTAFGWEEHNSSESDLDFNDLIFQINGLTGNTGLLDEVIAPELDWRTEPALTDLMALINSFPVAENLQVEDITNNPTDPRTLTIEYASGTLNPDSLDNSDIRISSTNGFAEYATFVGAIELTSGIYQATYSIAPPSGGWDYTYNGTYRLTLEANQITDSNGNSAPETELGTFTVDLDPIFSEGVFTVGASGSISFDFLFDGGGLQGQLGLFSLEGLEEFTPETSEFIRETLQRAASHIPVIDDINLGARFSAEVPPEPDFNSGEYLGETIINLTPGETFGLMLIPGGTIEDAYNNSSTTLPPELFPLYLLGTASENDQLEVGQLADITGDALAFALEDVNINEGGSDRDYNDVIFIVEGASTTATLIDEAIDPSRDWRDHPEASDLINYINDQIGDFSLSISDTSITEGDTENTIAQITISLNASSNQPITVDYTTSDSTATAGNDYTATSGTITFNPGDPLTQTLDIEISADTIPEAEESFNIVLSNPSNATLEKDTGNITIIDNDDLISEDIILTENSDFQINFTQPLNLSNPNTILKLTYADLNFDLTDPDNINDAFEVALTDSFGNSLVHTIGGESNAYFNLTEGEPSNLASGVTLEGETVSLNLASVHPGTEATLTLRLVNNDSDTTTSVRITDIEIVPEDGSIPPAVTINEPPSNNLEINFENLTDVSSSLQAEYFQTSYNEQTQQLLAEIAIRNQGSYGADTPLLVAIDRISDPTVRVRNAAGFTPEGLPYYDFSHLVADGMLSPGETTEKQTLSFYNPREVQFTYELVILSELNASPIIESQPPTEIIFGQTYDYEVIATDADEDTLNYEILSGPAGLTIDSESGLINWQTTEQDIANHAITVRVSDSRGGEDVQTFNLSVIAEPPNRPPIFTSTPVVDAWINQLYSYDSEAVDPDLDPLGYTLILGPDGVTVHPTEGQVEWTPQPVLVIGDTVLGQLNLPGDSDEFSLSGVAGQWLYFDPLQYSGTQTDWNFSIYSPSGERLTSNYTNLHFNNNQLLKLTESGTYKIVVDTTGDTIGNYGFSIIDLDLLPLTPFDTVIEGQLVPGSEDDVFRFTGSAGQKLYIDKISNSGTLDWVLYNSNGEVLLANGNFEDLEYYLPNDGDYILALRGKTAFTDSVDYEFEIITPEEITTEITLGSNDSPEAIEAEITEKGEEDFYTFTGSAGQQIYLDRWFADLTNVWALTATIISPSGQNVLARNFYHGDDPEPITLSENGTYKIRLDTSGQDTGTYSFSLLDFESATPINLDAPIRNTLDSGQETHLYQIDLTSGQHLFFDTEGGTTNADWSFYDEGNTRLNHVNLNTDIETTISTTGTYTLAIRGHNGTTPVNYSFQVITPETETLALDTAVTAEISEKGERDIYTFAGTEGQRLFLDVLEENPQLRATLVSPSGTKLIDAKSMERDDQRHPLILPESGNYQVVIDGDLETTGSYSFQLVDITASPQLEIETVTRGILDPGSSIEFYQFEGNRGERLYLDSQENTSNSYWHLYNANNTRLTEAVLSSDIEEVLLGEGTYYLMLRGENSTPTNYAINLVRTFDEDTALTPDTAITGTIEKLGERDIYTFEGTIGQTLYFDAIEGDSNITVTLESPTERLVTNGNTAEDSNLITLRESGTYQLIVDGNNDTTGNYSFQLKDTALPLSLGSPVDGNLAAGETLLYELTGTAGQQLSFESTAAEDNTSWVLYAPSRLIGGNRIIKDVPLETDLTVTLPSNGTYTLALRNSSEDAGNYEFSVTDISAVPETNSELGAYSGGIDVGEVDSYTLTANAGTLVFFNGQGDNWQLRSRLYHPDETLVYNNLDNRSDAGPYLLTQTGTYRLEAYGFYGSTVGNYSFQLLDLSSAPELTLNTDTSISLAPVEAKAYKFTGGVDQKIWFDGLNTTNPNVTAALYNPNGSLLSSGSLSNLQLDTVLLSLEAEGTYYLVLSSNNSSATEAEFRLLDNSEAEELAFDTQISGDFGQSKREAFLYKFNGVAGDRLYFDRFDGDYNNYWLLSGPEGNSIASNRLNADLEVVLPGDGEYLLSVYGYGGSNSAYEFRVETSSSGTPEVTRGTPITGEISVAGEQDTYTFEGTENQWLWFDSLATASGIEARLYSPSGTNLWRTSPTTDNGHNVAGDREPTFLKETGTYRLVVDALGETTGSYNFRLLDLDADVTSVELGTNITGNFGESKREAHLYNFPGEEGQYLYFDRFDGTSSNNYYLYSPNGERLFNQRFDFDYEGPAAILPNDGIYTLVFSGNGSSNNNYDLQLVTPEFLTESLTVGETVSGEISEAGERDIYTFTGRIGQQLWFDSLEYSDYQIEVKLLSPSGEELFGQDVRDDREPVVLAEAGTYRVIIDGLADVTGSYTFRFLDLAEAESTSLDSEISGDFGESKREAKLYSFAGNEGDYLYFDRREGHSSNYYYLYDPNGVRLFSQFLDRDYEGPAAILPRDGQYTLVLSGNNSPNNNYRLQIVTSEFVSSSDELLGTTIAGEISEVGEQDTYTFEGRIGQQLWFDSLEYSDLGVKLFSPTGEEVLSQLVRDEGEPVVLGESGTYSLVIDAPADVTGTYSFRLLDLAVGTLIEQGLVSGNFGTGKREAQVYTLAKEEGDYLYFDLLQGEASNAYYFYDQYGQRLFHQQLDKDSELELPETGEYKLVVAGLGAANSAYELELVNPEQLTFPLALNETISSEISLAGERDTYLFEGTVGQQLFFDAIKGDSQLTAKLYSPSEAVVVDGTTQSDWLPFTLGETGRYKLVIDYIDNRTGDYSFTLSDRARVPALEFDTPIAGTLDPGKTTHLYQLMGTAGQQFSFDLEATSWTGASWTLYDPKGEAIASPPGNNPDFNSTLPSTGLYTLAIAGTVDSPVEYSLTVSDNSSEPLTPMGLGVVESGTVNAGETIDYEFSANAGTQVFFDGQESHASIWAKLLDQQGNLLFSNYPVISDLAPLVLPETGTYTLQIYGANASIAGDYQFQLLEFPQTLRSPGVNYLEIGSVVSGSLDSRSAKVYTFSGVPGQRVMFNGMAGTNVGAALYDPNGHSIFARGNFGTFDNGPHTLTQEGLYQLVLTGEVSQNRDYSFQLLELDTVPEIRFNLPVTGELANQEQVQFYKFSGEGGQRVFFDSLSPNSWPGRWQLYDASNTLLSDSELRFDFEYNLPYTGEYALLVNSGNAAVPFNYAFQVFAFDEDLNEVIVPGTGEGTVADDGSIGQFPIFLNVEDFQGGEDTQNYNIQLHPDPTNANPVILSEPVTRFSLEDGIYRYQLDSIDPDDDPLRYRLIDSPLGSSINSSTGELLWFGEQVPAGETVEFTVGVIDGRGGLDTQTFSVEVFENLATIQGAVFDDLNGNGLRDTKLVRGDNPSVVLAIDVSGSTAAPFVGDDEIETVLDAQVAASLALIDTLIGQGQGDRINIGLIPHNSSTVIQDMNPATPDIDPYTTPLADNDNNGVADIRQILESYYPLQNNDFTSTLQEIDALVDALPGDPNVIFMSDGYGHLDPTVASDMIASLETKGVNLNAFGIGHYSTMYTLQLIDPEAIQLTDIEEFIDIFAGWDDRYAIEPLLEEVTIYLDLNNNGSVDAGEPQQLTQKNTDSSLLGEIKPYYIFDGLLPGDYTLRQVIPNGMTQTVPETETYLETITSEGETLNRWFGLHQGETQPPNSDPVFLTEAPSVSLEAGEVFVYAARAIDADADPLTYGLILNPEGMTVDRETGTVVWNPTALQGSNYYRELQAEKDRLAASGRGDFVPDTVKFNVFLVARDGRGGQGLQQLDVELVAPNNSPIFVSSFSADYQAQVGKLFEYQAAAIDADGDELIYELIESVEGLIIDEATGLVSGTFAELGRQELTISVSDGRGGEALQVLEFEVVEAGENQAPVIGSSLRTTAVVGQVYLSQLQVTDDVSGGLSFQVFGPEGMTIDEEGLISWTPTAGQLGSHAITVEVTDAENATSTREFEIEVRHRGVNKPPRITSVPEVVTTIKSPYLYELEATDPDGDYLVWTLANGPSGMVIDAVSGVLSWQPGAVNIGEHLIDVRVVDAGGLDAGQEFLLRVTGANTAPQIVSVPPTEAGVDEGYIYQAVAADLENDGFEFALGSHPEGMRVDEVTGEVSWTPVSVGSYEVEVRVTDELGASSSQVYTLEVGEERVNNAPEIVSTPVYLATPDGGYSYQVEGTDVDGDSLYYELISGPDGMGVDEVTGLVSWSSPVVGSHSVVVGVNDGSLGAAQGYSLTVRGNSLPEISLPGEAQMAVTERLYRYDLQVSDAEGDEVSFQLVSAPDGMSIDDEGRISWFPDNDDVGDYDIEVRVTDSFGGETTGSFSLAVTGDDELPVVELLQGFNFVYTGTEQVLWVAATDNVGVATLGLVVDGEPVAVSPDGVAAVSFDSPGFYQAIATATDAAGNQGTASVEIEVLGESDGESPVVSLDELPEDLVTSIIELTGTVTDDNLADYKLEAAPIGTGNFITIFEGNQTVIDGVLGEFDPTLLLNDTYTLRLTATDTGGISSFVEETIDVGGDLKLGNFQMSFTDLEVPVSGIPISVTRTYDSLAVGTQDDFGPGWRLEFRDTDLRTSLGPDETFEQFGIREKAFDERTRVYITLPGGKREAFTFSPTVDRLSRFVTGRGGEGGWFRPAFTSQDGSFNTLTVKDVLLTRNPDGEYVGLNGEPYNPENPLFGGTYTLTTKEGIVYQIDAVSGDLLTVKDRNGNTLTFTDDGIKSDTGKEVTFQRDARGRIEQIFDPMGEEIVYDYDAVTGDLIGVTDREENRTTFEYEEPTRVHYLTGIDDPLGQDAVRNEYDELGRLQRILDVNGEAVELVYDPDNSTQTVKDVFGYETFYEYDERGNILQEVDPVGLKTVRTYDDDNNLLTETVITPESGPDGWTTEWTYDGNGNQLTKKDELGNITRWRYNQWGQMLSETDPLGNTTSYSYDGWGNEVTRTNALGDVALESTFDLRGNLIAIADTDGKTTQFDFDQFGNMTRMVDALGHETTYIYDANGNRLTETTIVTTSDGFQTQVTSWTYDAEGSVLTKTDPLGNVTRQEYDALGNLVAVIEEGMDNRRTEYEYDDKGQLIKTVYPDGTFESSVYDEAGREITAIDRAGQATHFVYDALGRVIETIYPDDTPDDLTDNPKTKTEYDKAGRITASIDEREYRTEYEYDPVGHRLLVRDMLGNETAYTYDAEGNQLTETDTRGNTTRFVYDTLGRKVEVRYADGTNTSTTYDTVGRPNSSTDRAGNVTYLIYDTLDRPIEVIYPDDTPEDLSNNPRTKTEYNELGWVIAQIDELGNRIEYEYDVEGRQALVRDALGNETSYVYNAAGNLVVETDSLNRTTEFVYDESDRLIETHFHDGTYIVTSYDELGRRLSQIDQAGNTTQFEYDARSRQTAVIDALDQRTEYRYDLAGNLIEIEDANDHTTQYEYDELNRRTATILPRGQRSETAYDPVGNVVSLTDFNGETIIYSYDEINQLIAKQFPDATKVEYTYTPTGQRETVTDQRGTTTYSYDVAGRLIERVDPDGQFVGYDYDAAGNRIEVITLGGSTTYSYNANGWLLTVTDPNEEVTRYSYNAVGNLVDTEFPNGTVETRSYDDLNRLVFLENTGPDGMISSYRYDLDAVGNRLSVEEDDGRQVSYDYDELYRLESETISVPGAGERTISYSYDPVGNRLTRNDSVEGTTSYVYNENDWLLSEMLNGEVTEYGYDENGNRLSRIKNGTEEVVYQWDYENRLVGADGTQQVEYQYDDNGVRVAAIVDGVETRYLIDANRPYAQVLEEYNPEGNIQASYVYGLDLISQERGEQESFYHMDGLGSTRVLTDDGGGVTDTYDYDAYGVLIASTGGTVNDYLYTGEQFDPNLGDYYLRARYYEPSMGRFLSRDPFEGFLIEPLSLAKYPYVHGNPVNAIDPSGLLILSPQKTTAISVMLKTLTTIRRASPYIGALGIVAGLSGDQANRSLATNLTPEHMRVKTLICQYNNLDCDFYPYPVIVYGNDLEQTTAHIRDALLGYGFLDWGYPRAGRGFWDGYGVAPSFLQHIYPGHPREDPTLGIKGYNSAGVPYLYNWYDHQRPCLWETFGGVARNGDKLTCDEYPFASTLQGGKNNYLSEKVSIRLVPDREQLLGYQGSQAHKMQQFYYSADVRTDGSYRSWFGVKTTTEDVSHFYGRKNAHYRINFTGNAAPAL